MLVAFLRAVNPEAFAAGIKVQAVMGGNWLNGTVKAVYPTGPVDVVLEDGTEKEKLPTGVRWQGEFKVRAVSTQTSRAVPLSCLRSCCALTRTCWHKVHHSVTLLSRST